jgi:hypothetical protein
MFFIIKPNKNYELRFVPNIKNPKQSIIPVKFQFKENSHTKNFSYIWVDDAIQPFGFGKTILDKLNDLITGKTYTNSEGYIINDINPICYYINSENKVISKSKFNCLNRYEQYSFIKRNDIVKIEPTNLFDVKSEYVLCFETCIKMGFVEITKFQLKRVKPLYKDGDDKNLILNLYNGVEPLEDVAKRFEQNILFGDIQRDRINKIKNILNS